MAGQGLSTEIQKIGPLYTEASKGKQSEQNNQAPNTNNQESSNNQKSDSGVKDAEFKEKE